MFPTTYTRTTDDAVNVFHRLEILHKEKHKTDLPIIYALISNYYLRRNLSASGVRA